MFIDGFSNSHPNLIVMSKNNQIFFSQIKKVFSKRNLFLVLPKSIEKEWSTDDDFFLAIHFLKTNFHTVAYKH